MSTNSVVVPEPIIDIKDPHTSAQTVNSIEFIQGGRTFAYDPNNASNNYFSTGDGPFTVRFYFSSNDISGGLFDWEHRLKLALTGFDANYHSKLRIDTSMLDDLPQILLDLLGVVAPHLTLFLHWESRDEIVKTVSESQMAAAPFVSGKGYMIEWTPSLNELYSFQTRIYLGDLDLTGLMETIEELIGLDLEDLIADLLPDLFPTELVQNIKYNIINQFKVTQQELYLLLFWRDQANQITYNGVTKTTHDFNVTNMDFTDPTYVEPEVSQETAVDDWQIKIRLNDEFEGSGIKNDSVYIWYSVNGGTFHMIEDPMLLGDDYYFYGTLPSQLANSEIKYYIAFSDIAGNEVQTATYTFYANPLEIQPVAILLIGIAVATIATIAATRIYRNRHQPRVITLPKKKKVDKYYKNINKEGGNM